MDKKTIIICTILCTFCCIVGGCKSTESSTDRTEKEYMKETVSAHPTTLIEKGTEAEYSAKTVILSVEEGTSDEQIYALADEYDMNVLYIMHNLNMCTLALKEPASETELDALFAELESKDFVLMAHKDYIMHLDDAGTSAGLQ